MKKKKWILVGFLMLLLIAVYYKNNLLDKLNETIEQLAEEETAKIDWDELKKRNPDICAWMCVPGTPIDYPVVQSADKEDGYYLAHDVDSEETIYGAIYTEPINRKDFTDPMTVVYGHNMRDGSMFGSLKKFMDADFFQKQDTIMIYLDTNEVLTYRIIAAYKYPANHLLGTFDFNTGAAQYFQKVPEFVAESGGNYRENEALKEPAITLSTCTANDSSRRYLVQGILIDRKKGE